MEKKFYYAPVGDRLGFDSMDTHWEHAIPEYRNAPHVWNVGGQDNVAVYLLDTGDGLVLFDSGLSPETQYLVVDRIWRTGHDPREIKKIFITHWHGDHTANVRTLSELIGPEVEIWISREDEVEHKKHAEDKTPMYVTPYKVTDFYDNSEPIVMGKFEIHTRLCLGHTPGTTVFFFEDTDEETGKTYRVALHGGIGVGKQLLPKELKKNGLDPLMGWVYVKTCRELSEIPVDITLCSHLNQGNILPNIPKDRNDYSVFVADYLWRDLLLNRADAAEKMLLENEK